MRRAVTISYDDWQVSEFRRRPRLALEYLNFAFELAFEDDDPEAALRAMAQVAKAQGIAKVAKAAGIKRESLHRMLSRRGNPEWRSLFRVMKALRVRPQLVAAGR